MASAVTGRRFGKLWRSRAQASAAEQVEEEPENLIDPSEVTSRLTTRLDELDARIQAVNLDLRQYAAQMAKYEGTTVYDTLRARASKLVRERKALEQMRTNVLELHSQVLAQADEQGALKEATETFDGLEDPAAEVRLEVHYPSLDELAEQQDDILDAIYDAEEEPDPVHRGTYVPDSFDENEFAQVAFGFSQTQARMTAGMPSYLL